jgi:hypothetical protein
VRQPSAIRNGGDDLQIEGLDRRLQALEHVISLYAPGSLTEKSPPSNQLNVAVSESETCTLPAPTKTTLNKSRLFGPTHWTNDIHEVGLAYYD